MSENNQLSKLKKERCSDTALLNISSFVKAMIKDGYGNKQLLEDLQTLQDELEFGNLKDFV